MYTHLTLLLPLDEFTFLSLCDIFIAVNIPYSEVTLTGINIGIPSSFN